MGSQRPLDFGLRHLSVTEGAGTKRHRAGWLSWASSCMPQVHPTIRLIVLPNQKSTVQQRLSWQICLVNNNPTLQTAWLSWLEIQSFRPVYGLLLPFCFPNLEAGSDFLTFPGIQIEARARTQISWLPHSSPSTSPALSCWPPPGSLVYGVCCFWQEHSPDTAQGRTRMQGGKGKIILLASPEN